MSISSSINFTKIMKSQKCQFLVYAKASACFSMQTPLIPKRVHSTPTLKFKQISRWESQDFTLPVASHTLFPLKIKTNKKDQKNFQMGKPGLLDLENHFAFYGAYHSNPVNILIHTLFVWPIFFTSLILFYFTPSAFDLSQAGIFPSGFNQALVFNYGSGFALFLALFYVVLDKKAGSLAALLCLACWVGASFIAVNLGYSLAWKVVLVAQLLCWGGQFLGHGVFEKRAPALLDNLVQALLMAPFFVLLEVLQSLFGYEPYPGFQDRVNAKIKADIKEWEDKKLKKVS